MVFNRKCKNKSNHNKYKECFLNGGKKLFYSSFIMSDKANRLGVATDRTTD